jgi:hypothetical protein
VYVRCTFFFVFLALICVADHIRLTLFPCLMLRSLLRIEQGQGGRGGGVMVIRKIAFKAKNLFVILPSYQSSLPPSPSPSLRATLCPPPPPPKNFMSGNSNEINCAINCAV